MKTAVLLPVYNPDVKFPAIVRELKSRGFVVVVCNDGSDPKFEPIFDEVKDKVYYVKNDCKDIWEWSEKVYEFAKIM